LILASGTWWFCQRLERAKAADRANQEVAARVAAARLALSEQRWDEAAALLQTAFATENATRLEDAQAAWTDLRKQQAADILRAAEAALERRDAAQSLSLLQSYLQDPYGADHAKAHNLKEQLERATSDAEAAARLHQLSDAALVDFARTGTLADLPDFAHPGVYAIHLDKLNLSLDAEFRRREEERANRARRIQATPVFGEFQEFVALSRRRLLARTGGGEIDDRLLARFFAEVHINSPDERQRIWTELARRPVDYDEAEKLTRLRAAFKERFRAYKDFDKRDWEMFDGTVDQEINQLLHELQGASAAGEIR
jgi:hypothetical protein